MSATAAPFGLKPVKRVDGQPFTGARREYLIDPAGHAANIFNGSVVSVNSSGYLALVTTVGSAAAPFPAGTVGVFVGCEYVNSLGYLVHSQYYPGGTVAPTGTKIKAYVVDDPMMLFRVQCEGSLAQTALGQNAYLANAQSTSTGSTMTGNSNVALDSTTEVTANAAFRIVEFVDDTRNAVGDSFTEVLVKFNPIHAMTNATGI